MKIKYFFFTLLIFTSCIKTVELPINNYIDSIVVNCLFRNNDTFELYLGNTFFILDSSENYIDTMDIKIKTNNTFYTLENVGNGKYIGLFNIQQNQELELYIDEKNISAINKIPSKISLDTIIYTFPYEYSEYYDAYLANLIIEFEDDFETNDFYEVFIAEKDNLNNANYLTTSEIINNENIMQYEPKSLIFSDSLFNGQTCNLNFSFTTGFHSINYVITPSDNYLIFNHISKEYYYYKKTLMQHKFLQKDENFLIFNLFTGDQANVFSNINNGLGIFAGYNSTKTFLVYENK